METGFWELFPDVWLTFGLGRSLVQEELDRGAAMFPLFSGVATLAGSIIDVWAVLEERRERHLDREHLLRLQKAQHVHDLLVQRQSSNLAFESPRITHLSDTFLERLRIEAILLSRLGFDIVYEPIGKGYGLAVPVSDTAIVAFWLSTAYPDQAPDIYLKTQREIERIEFEENAWEESHSMAEIVSAMALEYVDAKA